VDDHLMRISHVIRGDEWLPSTPKHQLIYEAFGWQPPKFAHLPLLLNASDRTKLSKRQKHANLSTYREQSILPEALINFVAFLGWTPPFLTTDDNKQQHHEKRLDEKTRDGLHPEILSIEALAQQFDLKDVHKSGAVVSVQKMKWFNNEYVKKNFAQDPKPIIASIKANVKNHFSQIDEAYLSDEYIHDVFMLAKDRLDELATFPQDFFFYFEHPKQEMISKTLAEMCDAGKLPKALEKNASNIVKAFGEQMDEKQSINEQIKQFAKQAKLKKPQLMLMIRAFLSAQTKGAPLQDMIRVLGENRVKKRLGV